MSISRRKAGTYITCLRCGESTQVPLGDGTEDANAEAKPLVATEPAAREKPQTPLPKSDSVDKRAISPGPNAKPSKESESKSNQSSIPAKDAIPPAVIEELFNDIEADDFLASNPGRRTSFAPIPPLPESSPINPPDPSRIKPSPSEPAFASEVNSRSDAVENSSLDEFDELFDPIARDEHEDILEQLHRSTSTMILPEQPDKDSYVPDEIFQEEDDARPVQFRRKRVIDDEMDLTPMVDVTFQLLIFFMVSASFSLQKSIEVPTPDPESKGASQQVKTLDDLQGTSIVVKIDATNAIWLDDEPLGDSRRLADTLRDKMRHEQKTELLISASSQSLHRTVISVIDAANEIGVQKIRMSSSKRSD